MKLKKRIIPKIRFTNYHKDIPASKGIWTKWLDINKAWGGSIINIQVKHYQLCLDFRKDWIDDLHPKKQGKRGEK